MTAGLTPLVVAAVLAAAVLHAAWNAIAHAVSDRLVGFAWLGLVSTVAGAGMALAAGPLPPAVWPLVAVSAIVHVGYALLLLVSYQLGEFSQAYPLARGSAPLLVTVVALVGLQRPVPAQELAGVLTICLGLLTLVLVGGGVRARPLAVAAALGTGVLIATYTIVDALAVVRAPVLAYTGWIFLLQGPALPLVALVRRGSSLPALLRRQALPGMFGGVVSFAAYTIVL